MAKYLVLWEVDTTKVPDKPEDRYENWTMMLDMIKKDMESGGLKEWGNFVGTLKGYTISERNEQEIDLALIRYMPYLKFKVYPVLSLSQVKDNLKALSQA